MICYPQCYAAIRAIFDGLGGSGNATAANLNSGTHGGDWDGGWQVQSLSGVSFSYVSGGSAFAHPISVCGNSYAGNTGKALRMTMPISNGSGGYWEFDQLTNYVGFSAGFAWSYTSTGLNNGVAFFALGSCSVVNDEVQQSRRGSQLQPRVGQLAFIRARLSKSGCHASFQPRILMVGQCRPGQYGAGALFARPPFEPRT